MSISTELRGTINHEAGHVVALCENGYIPKYVEVTSESTGSADCSDADLAAMDDNAIFTIALAGIHAESKVRPEASVEEFARIISGGSGDRHVVDAEFRRRRGVVTALFTTSCITEPRSSWSETQTKSRRSQRHWKRSAAPVSPHASLGMRF